MLQGRNLYVKTSEGRSLEIPRFALLFFQRRREFPTAERQASLVGRCILLRVNKLESIVRRRQQARDLLHR
jgi:hypothetical protein